MMMQDAWSLRSAEPAAGSPSFEALFSYGFRPFFLGAAVFTIVLMTVWLGFIANLALGGTGAWLPVAGSPYAWHAHEMVFGFAAAAIAGFLLTAVPNWTGALPLSGAPLVGLFLLWGVGRVVMAFSGVLPPWIVAAADVAFIPVLGAFAAWQLFVKPAARNLVFLALLLMLCAANAAYHLATYDVIRLDPLELLRNGLLVVGIIIAVIGGRIIPSFTHNWLHINRPGAPLPRRLAALDASSILSIVAILIARVLDAPDPIEGAIALVAATLNATRLVFWRGWGTRAEPIVWVLHAGYAWLVIALALIAASHLTPWVPATLANHALGTGAVGLMILAVMSRASLGHTGRRIIAPAAIVAAYRLVSLAAHLRVLGPLIFPDHQGPILVVAAAAWISAFLLFIVVYGPILTTPRVHAKLSRA
jgi:uncharacterized protein involved in response to NO